MKTTLDDQNLKSIFSKLSTGNKEYSLHFPGDSDLRQPVHTVYGGAHLFKHNTTQKIAEVALNSFKEYAKNPQILAKALGIKTDANFNKKVFSRVESKLKREAVEDFRIDFEDGFGNRPNEEEDQTAITAALEVAEGMKKKTLPPFIGIRIKSLTEDLKSRSARTLDLFITTLVKATNGKLPDHFVITYPKILHIGQVEALIEILQQLERKLSLPHGTLKIEFMVETPQTLFTTTGAIALPSLVKAAQGRCVAAHFGTYDYTASVNITANYQTMDHPACDFARSIMKVALAGTGIWLSDGATNVMPVGPHKGKKLTPQQKKINEKTVHEAWKLNYSHIRHSLKNAIYQGWDLHPAQLPIRYAALYIFFLESLESASVRLSNFVQQAAKATLVGDIFDDAATGQGLLNFFLKALNCGAITEDEITKAGLTLDEVKTRSFLKIIEGRRGK